jgi:hypothetical protein
MYPLVFIQRVYCVYTFFYYFTFIYYHSFESRLLKLFITEKKLDKICFILKEKAKSRRHKLPVMSPLFKLLHPSANKSLKKNREWDLSSSNQGYCLPESTFCTCSQKERRLTKTEKPVVWEKTTSKCGLPCSYSFCGWDLADCGGDLAEW